MGLACGERPPGANAGYVHYWDEPNMRFRPGATEVTRRTLSRWRERASGAKLCHAVVSTADTTPQRMSLSGSPHATNGSRTTTTGSSHPRCGAPAAGTGEDRHHRDH